MGRFLLMLATSTALALALILYLPLTGLARASSESQWTASLYAEKERAAHNMRGPRVLFLGGSSTLFSLDAKRAGEIMARPALNFGTHAGLGLDYLLARGARVLRAGDIIVLAPEYELLTQTDTANELAIQLVAFSDRRHLDEIQWQDRPRYLMGYQVIPSLVSGVRTILGKPALGRTDIWLDETGTARGNTVALSNADGFRNTSPNLRAPSPARLEKLKAFADIARRKGARVFVVPPALISTPGYRANAFHEFQEKLFRAYTSLGIPCADPTIGFLLPEDMYDSVYHANDRGRATYTNRVTSAICQQIGCP